MKQLLIITVFLLSCFAKGQTIHIDYSQFFWTDIAPDSSMRFTMSGSGSFSLHDTLRIDLTNDSQPDFFMSWISQGGLGGHYDATKIQGLNGAAIAVGDSMTPYLTLARNFNNGDSIQLIDSFTSNEMYVHMNGWQGGPNPSSTQYSLLVSDTMVHICVKTGGILYFIEIFRNSPAPINYIYVAGFYTAVPVGLRSEEEQIGFFSFSNDYFSCIFKHNTNASFSITDMTGREIQGSDSRPYNKDETVAVKLPSISGIYIMNVFSNGSRRSLKFVVL